MFYSLMLVPFRSIHLHHYLCLHPTCLRLPHLHHQEWPPYPFPPEHPPYPQSSPFQPLQQPMNDHQLANQVSPQPSFMQQQRRNGHTFAGPGGQHQFPSPLKPNQHMPGALLAHQKQATPDLSQASGIPHGQLPFPRGSFHSLSTTFSFSEQHPSFCQGSRDNYAQNVFSTSSSRGLPKVVGGVSPFHEQALENPPKPTLPSQPNQPQAPCPKGNSPLTLGGSPQYQMQSCRGPPLQSHIECGLQAHFQFPGPQDLWPSQVNPHKKLPELSLWSGGSEGGGPPPWGQQNIPPLLQSPHQEMGALHSQRSNVQVFQVESSGQQQHQDHQHYGFLHPQDGSKLHRSQEVQDNSMAIQHHHITDQLQLQQEQKRKSRWDPVPEKPDSTGTTRNQSEASWQRDQTHNSWCPYNSRLPETHTYPQNEHGFSGLSVNGRAAMELAVQVAVLCEQEHSTRKISSPRPQETLDMTDRDALSARHPNVLKETLLRITSEHPDVTSKRGRSVQHNQGQKRVEDLWRQFFSEPVQWWDHRADKVNPRYPDFKHRTEGLALWINARSNPEWVKTELATMTPGHVPRSPFAWNATLSGYVKSFQWRKALELFRHMQAEGVRPDSHTFGTVLNACASLAALEEGRSVHAAAIQSGYEWDLPVVNSLLDMYAKCGSLDDARRVFDEMPTRDVVSWTAMVRGYVKCDQGLKALELYQKMQKDGVKPNSVTFATVLSACGSSVALEQGRRIHAEIVQSGFESDLRVGNCLLDMYAKCCSIEDCQRVFNRMPKHDVVSWTTLLAGYVKCEQGQKAMDLYQRMQAERVQPNALTFATLVSACASSMALEMGRRVHAEIIDSGWDSDLRVGNGLVYMYAKCGSIEDARRVFDEMPSRDVVSWTAMLAGYVKCRQIDDAHRLFCEMPNRDVVSWNSILVGCVKCQQEQKALELYQQMQAVLVKPNSVTFGAVLSACAILGRLEEGRKIHAQIVASCSDSGVYVGGSLIDMYSNCGSMKDARRVFDEMPVRDVVVWTAMLTGYVKCEAGEEALELYRTMQVEGVKPNAVTFATVLKACTSAGPERGLKEGRCIHSQVVQSSCESDVIVASCLVDMYAKCGSIDEACTVFNDMPSRDVMSWTSMLVGYVNCGHWQKALNLYRRMKSESVKEDAVVFVVILNACAGSLALGEGRSVHADIIESGCESDVSVGNSLVNMYAKCGSLADAWRVFNGMPSRDVISWTTMLRCLAGHGQGMEALRLFEEMLNSGMEMNSVVFISVLSACSHSGLVDEGLQLFESMSSAYHISPTPQHYACAVDLLGRAGRLVEAEEMIRRMSPDGHDHVVAMRSLLGGCRNYRNLKIGEGYATRLFELNFNDGNVVL